MSAYHVEVMLCVCASQQVPYEHVPIVASRQDDPGVKRVRFEDKHLCLVALKNKHTRVDLWFKMRICGSYIIVSINMSSAAERSTITLRICSSCPV